MHKNIKNSLLKFMQYNDKKLTLCFSQGQFIRT